MGTLDKKVVHLSGSFAPAGTGAVTTVLGKGFSVARTGVGQYTVTLQDPYRALLSCTATCQNASAASGWLAQLGATDVITAQTIVINTLNEAAGAYAAADMAAGANNRVHFTICLANSSIDY